MNKWNLESQRVFRESVEKDSWRVIFLQLMLKQWSILKSPVHGNFKVPPLLVHQKICPPFHPGVQHCQWYSKQTHKLSFKKRGSVAPLCVYWLKIHWKNTQHRSQISWLSLISWHGCLTFPDHLCRFYKSTTVIKSCWPLVEYPGCENKRVGNSAKVFLWMTNPWRAIVMVLCQRTNKN